MEKNNGENNFLHFPIPKMEKNNGEKVKTGNFLHYWNGEKEWGKNINNGEKLLMKMGKILSWILGNEGVSSWLGYIGMMNSSGVGQYYWGTTFGSLCAIFDTNVWCKANSMASSDIRIKKILKILMIQ